MPTDLRPADLPPHSYQIDPVQRDRPGGEYVPNFTQCHPLCNFQCPCPCHRDPLVRERVVRVAEMSPGMDILVVNAGSVVVAKPRNATPMPGSWMRIIQQVLGRVLAGDAVEAVAHDWADEYGYTVAEELHLVAEMLAALRFIQAEVGALGCLADKGALHRGDMCGVKERADNVLAKIDAHGQEEARHA